jgi:hypothetical protein
VLAFAIACGGCAGDHHAPRAPAIGSSETEAPIERRASIRFDVEGVAAVPLVRATIGRVSTWMQLDSGASEHTMPGFLARRAELAPDAGASRIVIDGWGRLDEGPLALREEDPTLPGARAGIAGLLSPQRLEPSRIVALDLSRSEMRLVTEPEATRVLASKKSELTATADRCQGMYVVAARVEGVEVRLLVDTGATQTALYGRSRAGTALLPRAVDSRGRSFSVDGAMTTRTYEAARIDVGDVHGVRDLLLLVNLRSLGGEDASACAEDGVLGIDVLRACVLVFDGRLRIRCG